MRQDVCLMNTETGAQWGVCTFYHASILKGET